MTGEETPLPARQPAHREVQFDGDSLIAVLIEGDGVAAPVRAICEVLGLNIEAQSDNLRKHPVLIREAFLAGQQELQQLRAAQESTDARVHEQAAQTDARLQAHDDLLTDLTQRLDELLTISSAQQQVIKAAVLRIATRYQKKHGRDVFARLFSEFCNDLNTPRYSALPITKYDEALAWLRRKADEYLPNDPDALPPLQETLL